MAPTDLDALTGLLTRAGLSRSASKLGDGRRIGALSIDIRDLRGLNELYGHTFGDRVVSEVARRLCEAAYDGDFVARVGGDEFVILANCVSGDVDDLACLQREVEDAISAEPIRTGDHEVRAGARVCAALIDLHDLHRLFPA